ncbi:Zinc/iron permease [Phascolomyces articulosus]|uniref:Zinc/iron permease n=1 Tax=Phascolomyces articulosus TaxID=60185 RepID=A0AAD5JLZ8_9FUNG|nr:Zinc/iron permease [Phascolomyces articulosus]
MSADDDNTTCSAEALTSYNRPIHIAAIFIIFGVAGFGVLIPIASKFMPYLGIPSRLVTFGKSFGVGVIIATAFIHMLQPANEKLTSACLGDVWHKKYPEFAMLFTMCSIFAMQLIEYLATTRLEHRFDSLQHPDSLQAHSHDHNISMGQSMTATGIHHHPMNNNYHITNNMAITTIPKAPQPPYQCTHEDIDNEENGRPRSLMTMVDESVINENYYMNGSRTAATLQPSPEDKLASGNFSTCPAHHHWHNTSSSHQSESLMDTKRWLSTVVLEVGILTHSVIIGITLGVTGQDEFTGLLIALSFHQFFEGFALGARIAEVNMINCKKAIGMASFFACTTPVGTAIGVGISSSYNENSAAALLAQGIFDAISSGILIYVGLVNLLASEMIFDDRFKKMRKSTQFGCFTFMYTGAAVMAVIGVWV